MSLVERVGGLNLLPMWKRQVRVWDSLLVPASLDRLVALLLHRFGLMGKEDRELLQSLVKPGMTVLDIGANQGLYSVLLSRLVGPHGCVLSFEPETDMYSALIRNLQANECKNVTAIPKAVGASSGELVLSRSLVHGGDNRLVRNRAGVSQMCRNAAAVVDSIDNLLGDRPVHFMKIDVQGWEADVFRGMSRCLERNRDVIVFFEFWPKGLIAAGSDPAGFLREILARGFVLQESGWEYPLGEEELPALINRPRGGRFTNFLGRLNK